PNPCSAGASAMGRWHRLSSALHGAFEHARLYLPTLLCVATLAGGYWLLTYRTPFNFKLIRERFDTIEVNATLQQVEEMLGPASIYEALPPHDAGVVSELLHRFFKIFHISRMPDFQRLNAVIAAHPDRYPPGSWFWVMWANPQDEDQWVAIFFAGEQAQYIFKKGF